MYAIVAQSGKQSIFRPGEIATVDRLSAEVGDMVVFDKVLGHHDGESISFGSPYLDNVQVTAKVIEHKRDAKLRIIHFKRRKHHMKWQGHRQNYTNIEIVAIESKASTKKAAKKAAAPKKPKAAAKSVAKKSSASKDKAS